MYDRVQMSLFLLLLLVQNLKYFLLIYIITFFGNSLLEAFILKVFLNVLIMHLNALYDLMNNFNVSYCTL